MSHPILITSFTTWKPEQSSNSSDDLLAQLLQRNLLSQQVHLLRQIPVDFELAPQRVLSEIERLRPRAVICCGMAETRSRLSIETNGKIAENILHTKVNVSDLIADLLITEISHDAGKFVCNHLYYSVLNYFQINRLSTYCLFIHVPVLNQVNLNPIQQDFISILNKISGYQVPA